MTRSLADILRNDRYNERELSGDGQGGDYERGCRKGWNDAMRHVEREAGWRASIDLVREFHERFGQVIAEEPSLDNEDTNRLRIGLLYEELRELAESLGFRLDELTFVAEGLPTDPVEALDALTDLQYVLDGAYLSLGFHRFKDVALAEVHRSNLTKLGPDGKPVLRGDGKILKPATYSPPDLRSILAPSSTPTSSHQEGGAPISRLDEMLASLASKPDAVHDVEISQELVDAMCEPEGGAPITREFDTSDVEVES